MGSFATGQSAAVLQKKLANGDVPTIKAGTAVVVGAGVKGNPQTIVGYQVHRDHTAPATSVHGFNMADYFTADGKACNPFGSDLEVGDGTQGASFEINHINNFQTTDQINLALGKVGQSYSFVSQNVLKSGVMGRASHFVAIDVLGVRETPGYGVANFEVDGPAQVNSQTGIHTTIKFGSNKKSAHYATNIQSREVFGTN